MKYRVVGWTHYDDVDVPHEFCSPAALQAILRDIRENGYLFTGWDHQETWDCAPVLNDGKMRRFTQRGFGSVMAFAHGNYTRMGYAVYAFRSPYAPYTEKRKQKTPSDERHFDPDEFVPETVENEEFTVNVTSETLVEAEGGKLKLADSEALTMLDAGDTLTLVTDDARASFLVTGAVRDRDISEEEEIEIMALSYSQDLDKQRLADQRFEAAPWVLTLTLEKKQ